MAQTTATLRERVADHIRVSAVDLPLDASISDKIDEAITDATEYLRELGLIWWADNAIPEAALWPMTLCVGAIAAPKCGKRGQGYEADWDAGQRDLAKIRPQATIETVRAQYF